MTRLKLRPGCHFAPVPQGLHCSFHGAAFVVHGPALLFEALDRRLGPLTDGVEASELAGGPGGSLLVPLLRVLADRGLLLDLDAAGGPPPTDPRHEEIVAHLEEHADQPYDLYRRLRRTPVAVTGTGPAADAATRSLTRLAVGTAAGEDRSADVTVQILTDAEQALPVAPTADGPLTADGQAAHGPGTGEPLTVRRSDAGGPPASPEQVAPSAAGPTGSSAPDGPAGSPESSIGPLTAGGPAAPGALLPVSVGTGHAVVGPVLGDPAQVAGFRAAVRRVAGWLAVLPQGPAPMPVGAVLAGSLAARRVVDRVTGLAPVDGMLVVHGPTAEVTAVPLPDGTATASWQPTDPDEPPGDTDPAVLTEPWRGLGRWLDPVGPEHRRPIAAVALRPVLTSTPASLTGWGEDSAAARRHALLALLRSHADVAGQEAGADPAEHACAGTTPAHATLDGLLRALAPQTLATPGRTLPPTALEHPTARALHSALTDYHGRQFDLALHQLDNGAWHLATARSPYGGLLAAEWGPSPASAAYAVLGTLFTAETTGGTRPPTGTWCVEHLTEAALTRTLNGLLAEHRVTVHRLAADPVLGPLPWTCARLLLR
ncbi:hypothetical protein [Kitasatospora terrestris]|uniref:Uncharacterized protein n=1 Tax=Kitasatospora terrestris TaxID=258051 RepID=A0ABP9DHZ7_9ACTN